MLLPSQKRQRLANSDWRIVILEGNAPVLSLEIAVVQKHDPPVKNSQTPNKFAAQKFRHQPLALASGMKSFRLLLQRNGNGKIFKS